jgi:hypothetical protein
MNLMKMIFQSIRGGTRKPQKDESMQIYFNDTHDIENRIIAEYMKPNYIHARRGDYLVARRVILKEVKTGLTDEEREELKKFHDRRCSRHEGNSADDDDESDAEGDEDEEMTEEERKKAKEAKEARASKKAERKIIELDDAQKESKHIDIEALIE